MIPIIPDHVTDLRGRENSVNLKIWFSGKGDRIGDGYPVMGWIIRIAGVVAIWVRIDEIDFGILPFVASIYVVNLEFEGNPSIWLPSAGACIPCLGFDFYIFGRSVSCVN